MSKHNRGGIEPKDEMADFYRLVRQTSEITSRKEIPMQKLIDIRRAERMRKVDALPVDMRELVHEYGFTIVSDFIACGVTKSRNIRHLVESVLNEFSPTRGSYSKQGIRTNHDV